MTHLKKVLLTIMVGLLVLCMTSVCPVNADVIAEPEEEYENEFLDFFKVDKSDRSEDENDEEDEEDEDEDKADRDSTESDEQSRRSDKLMMLLVPIFVAVFVFVIGGFIFTFVYKKKFIKNDDIKENDDAEA